VPGDDLIPLSPWADSYSEHLNGGDVVLTAHQGWNTLALEPLAPNGTRPDSSPLRNEPALLSDIPRL